MYSTECPSLSQVPLAKETNTTAPPAVQPLPVHPYGRPLCGDWSRKLKLLRRVVADASELIFHLHTDHSRGFPGEFFFFAGWSKGLVTIATFGGP